MNDRELGVHINHCCEKHGCKYGDEYCPVVIGLCEQIGPCWDCDDEARECGELDVSPEDDSIKVPGIEWRITEKRKSYENARKSFWKGFIWAFLIIIFIHIGIAYYVLL